LEGTILAAAETILAAYLADVFFIDGQALTPTSFGAFDATTGVWNPIAYTGSYGTNGFHLPFSDNSAATAAALGKDTSGNGNNFTPSNLSVTAGAGNDSLVDSPTNGTASSGGDAGGTVVGNYATLNPLDSAGGIPLSLTNGNLETVNPANNWKTIRSTWFLTTGKWYWEHTVGSGSYLSGVATAAFDYNGGAPYEGLYGRQSSNKYDNADVGAAFSTTTGGDILMFAIDVNAQKMWTGKNGAWNGSGNPATGASADWTSIPTVGVSPMAGAYNTTNILNFGQRPFSYAAPSGFKSLNTANLPTPTILKGSDYFDTKLYTGNGSTQTISGLAFSPDFVWIKNRR